MGIGNESAFPVVVPGDRNESESGMSYRMWLVGMAMQGILAHTTDDWSESSVAKCAIDQADAILAALEKES